MKARLQRIDDTFTKETAAFGSLADWQQFSVCKWLESNILDSTFLSSDSNPRRKTT